MSKLIAFGENVEGYKIQVLNEREIRAAAGLLFLGLLGSIMFVHFEGNFLFLKYFVTVFLADMVIRVNVNPNFSPSLILGRLIVSKQVPEYVGAPQKRFAWKIGLALAISIFFFLVIMNSHSPITVASCLVCLLFLFFESAFGICLGCLLYSWYYKERAEYCSGEICERTEKQDIQKISKAQVAIILCFAVFVLFLIILVNDRYSESPTSLWAF